MVELEQEQRDLRQQIGDAEAQVQQFQEESTTSSATLTELNRNLAAARLAAGLTSVTGPGAIIEIADSQRVVPSGREPGGLHRPGR